MASSRGEPTGPHPVSTDFSAYTGMLRRRRLLIASFALAGLVLAGLTAIVVPGSYTATTEVLVTSTGVQEPVNTLTPRQREVLNLDTEAKVAGSAVVAAGALRGVGVTGDPDRVRRAVTVQVPPNSAILAITYTAGDPLSAASGSRAVARAYLNHRANSAKQAIAGQLKTVEARIGELNARLAKLARTSAAKDGPVLLRWEQSMLGRQISALTTRYNALRTTATTSGSVISDAVEPASPSFPDPLLFLGSGLVLGLFGGVGVAFLADRGREHRLPERGRPARRPAARPGDVIRTATS
ncbi:Wzz/FepE/Etk N-terminal domain-containing protein [Rhizohabitans arisaemae]|uniref:Wzz/FepE/Etk N-terminal domain-containing protein n=1 Tax=Rhizohabitans arisaemae TaxID=2720610 RepID=UPI0024B28531|nr:Wzz/FepE/Etk N-terminal domain-containing protein [Rhizohabitans arisaemae]